MENQDATIYLKDYRPHPYRIRFTRMELDLDTRLTRVRTVHDMERRSKTSKPLVLDCDSIDVESVRIDGREPEEGLVTNEGKKLIIGGLPESCQVEIVNTLDPSANTQLSGLYQSGSMLCTQCEAEGFRRITPSIDRPDNLATYRVILRG
ncbi:MAG: aminopeptidase N, partial [Gammaproteobacteria bacterium]|nr:aminopeptidase N [Gammaproteobacteria bacterium]